MTFIHRIEECRRFDPEAYQPFAVAGAAVGLVRHDFTHRLRDFPGVFQVGAAGIRLDDRLADFPSRTRAVADVLETLRAKGEISGWRDEAYPVATSFSAPPLMTLERAAVPLFGVRGYGVHMNGVVGGGADLRMWVAKRSLTKPTGPGKLDQLVAGGQPAGVSLADNLIKECAEEAAIPPDLARRAVPIGAVSYVTERPEGLRRDILFNYDLELPESFRPDNADGEVVSFHLWPIARVIETVRDTDDFKFNCALVVIDFLIRRGLIVPDHPDYVALIKGLHE
jgi:8-oxo-dGTP pyrophosphatase MutT (NUDIX family)